MEQNKSIQKMSRIGSVKNLTLLPLIDYYSAKENLYTEAGVSYYIQADKTKLLMDAKLLLNR